MPKNEKWEISPKFERGKTSCEIICSEIVDQILEKCFPRLAGGDLDNPGEDVSPSTPSVVGVWVPDPSLPDGWKTCLITRGDQRSGASLTPEKRMFYSPCGKLFSNRLSLDKFLETTTTTCQDRDGYVGRGGVRNETKVKVKKPRISPKSETIRPVDLCKPKLEVPSDTDDEVSDAISLSDDDFEDDFKEEGLKRKYEDDGNTKCPRSKKRKLSYSRADNSRHFTRVQEKILEDCYKEWPSPFPDLMEKLVKETGLVGEMIDDWFERKTDRCLQALFCQDT